MAQNAPIQNILETSAFDPVATMDLLERYPITTDLYHQMIEKGILTEDDKIELLEGEFIKMSAIGPRLMPKAVQCASIRQVVGLASDCHRAAHAERCAGLT